ncbi:MAG: hypothetical protein ACLTSX_06680 [Collinsella sp.]
MAQIAPGAEVSIASAAVSVPLYGSVKMKVAASFSGFGGVDGSHRQGHRSTKTMTVRRR